MAKEKNKTELPKVMEGELRDRLIQLREDAGFDVSQMANALCLSEEVINNLENEAFDLLPEPPYVRGYLRNYAKLGNEDSIELISRYESLRGADNSDLHYQIKSSKVISNSTKKRLSPIWGQIILLGIFVGLIALVSSIPAVNNWITEKWNSFSSQIEPTDASNNPSLLGNLPVPAPLPDDTDTSTESSSLNNTLNSTENNAERPQANNTDQNGTASTSEANQENTSDENPTATTDSSSEPVVTAEDNTETSTENTPEATETETEAETTTQEQQEISSTSSDGSINIKLVFNKEVWLRIKDKDNKNVFEGLNKAGTERVIALMKPLTFRVGNAQGLSLFIDNEAVDISTYINGSIANFTLE